MVVRGTYGAVSVICAFDRDQCCFEYETESRRPMWARQPVVKSKVMTRDAARLPVAASHSLFIAFVTFLTSLHRLWFYRP